MKDFRKIRRSLGREERVNRMEKGEGLREGRRLRRWASHFLQSRSTLTRSNRKRRVILLSTWVAK